MRQMGPFGLIWPSCLTRPFVADAANKANTADLVNNADEMLNDADDFKEAKSINSKDSLQIWLKQHLRMLPHNLDSKIG
jgi:hypothetical protein